jgi:hypothetical protein
METGSRVTALVDQLIDLFNKRSMDLPDGLFDRRTQFVVNGTPFEELLGKSSNDPLVLMLTRGPAGYRFTAKALQHAVPDAKIERGELAETVSDGRTAVRGQSWLSGHLRGTGEPTELVFAVELAIHANGWVERVAVTLDEAGLARIREARLRN